MKLSELKAALDAAAEALKANPEDSTLKANYQAAKSAYDEALAASQNDDDEDESEEDESDDDESKTKGKKDELDVSKLDPKVQKLISDLRKENADRRKQNKTLAESNSKVKQALVEAGIIEDDEESPEEKLKATSQTLNNATVENAVLKAALENGVGKDDFEFFSFLVTKKLDALKDDEEMTDEDLAELAKKARRGQAKAAATTTVAGNGSKRPDGDHGDVTLEEFVGMTMGEKSELYQKNPDRYSKLMTQAKAKRLI